MREIGPADSPGESRENELQRKMSPSEGAGGGAAEPSSALEDLRMSAPS